MTKPEYVAEGVMMFAEKELLPALEGWKMWTAGAALLLAKQQATEIMEEFVKSKAAVMLRIANEDGDIDVEAVGRALKQTARSQGSLKLDIPLFDIEFSISESNVDTLLDYIDKASGK